MTTTKAAKKTPKKAKGGLELTAAHAKVRLGELLHRVSVGGETVTITRYGRPVALLVAVPRGAR